VATKAEHGWQLSGSSADAYEEFLVPAIFDGWARSLVDLADPRPDERVLDVACGTGVVARAAAPRVHPAGTVTGVDVNRGMLDTARSVGGAAIEWRQAEAANLPFPDASFDVGFCQQGLQFMADREAAAHEMRRVLATDGRLALSVWRAIECSPAYAAFADALERHAAGAGQIMRTPFAFGDEESLRQLLLGSGFDQVRVVIDVKVCRFPSVAEFLRQEATASQLAGPVGRLVPDARHALVADLEDVLAPYVDDNGLALPIESHVALAGVARAARAARAPSSRRRCLG
jgi:ubiquinone/menaquinone biosynthesis C-methylase UbiE